MVDLTLVIPVKDERQSLQPLHREITSALGRKKWSYEIIFIDDGSQDGSQKILERLKASKPNIHIITFRTNRGKSAALAAGFAKSNAPTIVTLDADLQDDPAEIPKLVAKLHAGYDVVTGWRKRRADTLGKRLSSWLFNQGTGMLTGIHLHDLNSGLKALRTDVARELYLHGELHRFIPILAAKKHYRVTELPVRHRIRKYGMSKFGFERSWRGIMDLLTTVFITDYAMKPAHFFGRIGLVLFGVGFLMDFYVAFLKITTGTTGGHIPLLLAGILFMVLGTQLISTGLIAEMIAYYFAQIESKK